MNKEWKQYAAIKHLDNLEMLKALFYQHSFGRHYHEGYALGVILQGSETYQCSKKINIAPKGSIVVVNPGEVHTGHASDIHDGWGYFMIYPHLSLVHKALEQLGIQKPRLPWFPDSVIFNAAFGKRLYNFMTAVESGDSTLALESHFLELLHSLIHQHADFHLPSDKLSKEPGKVKQITDKIHMEYCENLSLESLSSEVGLSSYALLRLFKKHMGISPYLIQTGLRIKKAKHHLTSGLSLADTAASCGFTDQSHMTRQFKRWMGITPGEYCRADSSLAHLS
ncbi:MAG: AraC family transcriptional regulator [Proteobacteria bacterium]|nr:AraC family transcriptional regulator [Pseudomonadota bacterium]MBU1585929.1 AraC family transcriptional regulator [Pseudomonadota bacterium]MBU2628571.1 AraC family transcriptional regulator [Pseudomonadota bacterium]